MKKSLTFKRFTKNFTNNMSKRSFSEDMLYKSIDDKYQGSFKLSKSKYTNKLTNEFKNKLFSNDKLLSKTL